MESYLLLKEQKNKTLYNQLLADKSTVLTRTDFSKVLTNDNTKTLYTYTEDSKTVYYFAGNATDNWVKFGKYQNDLIRSRYYSEYLLHIKKQTG